MAPERKLYQKVKKAFNSFSLIRLENNSLHGTPDLLGYNNSGHFFTIELKVTQGKKLKNILMIFRLLDLKIIAYMVLPIYWLIIILATFSLSN